MISNITDALIVVEEQAQKIEKLRQQIEDLKCCGNCSNQYIWYDGFNRCLHNMTEEGCKAVDPTKKINYWEGLKKA